MAKDTVEPGTQARPWLALVALLLGVSLIVLEGSIVNVLIPTIVQDLNIDRSCGSPRSTPWSSPRCSSPSACCPTASGASGCS
jgi:hypothetical protein